MKPRILVKFIKERTIHLSGKPHLFKVGYSLEANDISTAYCEIIYNSRHYLINKDSIEVIPNTDLGKALYL